MGGVVKKISNKAKIWLACVLAIILVVGSAGGSFFVVSKIFENKFNHMLNDAYKGETGEPGPQGPQGISITSIDKTGVDGNHDIYTITYSNGLTTTFNVKNGTDGAVPEIGDNGNWWLNGTDTGVPADVSLTMPHIGTNGNWWLGETDTGVRAQGQDGLTPYIKNGTWWLGDTDTGVAVGGAGSGITAITPLAKDSAAYQAYLDAHPELDPALTDVYQILYGDDSVSYFTVTNGRDGNTGASDGANGADANRWLNGTQAPAATLGRPGDFYLHTPTNTVYQKQLTTPGANQYDGVRVTQTLPAATFAQLQEQAANYGLIIDQGQIAYQDDITMAQIATMATETGLDLAFYDYAWTYVLDYERNAHLAGYYAADGALSINNGTITKIQYAWQPVTTLQGANGSDGQDGASAYEVWRDFEDAEGNYPNKDKDENAFLNSLIIGSLEDFTILPSGFWGKKTDLANLDDIPESEQYKYEQIDGIWYENTLVSARGEQGATGQKGEQGAQGARGYSAYELYTQTTTDNPVKSLDDWFASLVGAKGEQGEQGVAGDTPEIGANGNWWIGGRDTGVSASVRIPYVGANGNWFINGVDQNQPARGAQGAAGNGIAKIEKSTVDGVVDTYKITYTNPDLNPGDDGYLVPFTFTVTNGTNGQSAYEVWRDFTDADGNQPNLGKTVADFLTALMGKDGNGIQAIDKITDMNDPHYDPDVDTYQITYSHQAPQYFTVRNGRDGLSAYEIWCQQNGYTDGADHYEEFFNSFALGTIEGLTILDNGNWGILSNYNNLDDVPADEKDNYAAGIDGKIYKDTKVPAKGEAGTPGLSAYEIYVRYFTANPENAGKTPLTEYQWLQSLRGEKGENGQDAQLEITEDGYWKIGGVKTNMKVQGDKGEQGEAGLTPHIGDNGNWWVGDTDLGVAARGEKGPQGDKGETGTAIVGVEKTSSAGAVDTYTIAFSNGSTSTFTVTNGTDGADGQDGATISMDFGVPTVAGKSGDLYINLNNGEMYRHDGTTWGNVVGTMRGSQWFTGTLTLTELGTSAGVNIDGFSVIKNDLYLNTNTYDIYKYNGDAWVALGNLRGDGAQTVNPTAWFDATTLPALPDGAAVGKWGIGGDTNWTNWGSNVSTVTKSNGILKAQNAAGKQDDLRVTYSSSSQIAEGSIMIIRWRANQTGVKFYPHAWWYATTYDVLSGSMDSTGDWQTTIVRYKSSADEQRYGLLSHYVAGLVLEIESYYVGNLDYSSQMMDLSGNYHNASVSGNYMTDGGLVLNKTVQTPVAWNTTNMTYFVDFASVQQPALDAPLFAVGVPGGANQFSLDVTAFDGTISDTSPLLINGSMAGRTVKRGAPLTVAVRVDGAGQCQYTVDGVAWHDADGTAGSAVTGASLYFSGSGSILRRAMVCDYYLDDAAVYAVFNHQTADLPNPQSPYKKDNPKTWGDGVLIDFGDGTAGIARKITFDKTQTLRSTLITHTTMEINSIISWGGVMIGETFSYSMPTRHFPTNNTTLIFAIDFSDHINVDYWWSNGKASQDLMPESFWIWVLFDYSHNENV